jgi:hypothetical protein
MRLFDAFGRELPSDPAAPPGDSKPEGGRDERFVSPRATSQPSPSPHEREMEQEIRRLVRRVEDSGYQVRLTQQRSGRVICRAISSEGTAWQVEAQDKKTALLALMRMIGIQDRENSNGQTVPEDGA